MRKEIKAYRAGREAAFRGIDTVKAWAPSYRDHSEAYQQGIRDMKAEIALDLDTEWDAD